MPTGFTVKLQGADLSQAYTIGDVFVMPSESETLDLVVLRNGFRTSCCCGSNWCNPCYNPGRAGKPRFCSTCVAKLRTALEDSEVGEMIGKAGRKEMEKYYWRAATTKIHNEQYSAALWF